jgi:hypothetical protein
LEALELLHPHHGPQEDLLPSQKSPRKQLAPGQHTDGPAPAAAAPPPAAPQDGSEHPAAQQQQPAPPQQPHLPVLAQVAAKPPGGASTC